MELEKLVKLFKKAKKGKTSEALAEKVYNNNFMPMTLSKSLEIQAACAVAYDNPEKFSCVRKDYSTEWIFSCKF